MTRIHSLALPIICLLAFTTGCSSSDDDSSPEPDGDALGAEASASDDDGAEASSDGTETGIDAATGTGNPTATGEAATVTLDATAGGFGVTTGDSADRWTYFNLDTGAPKDLSDVEADASTDWHVAFKRVNVKLNGGASGPGAVTGGLIDAQADFYDAAGEPDIEGFTAATTSSELPAFSAPVDTASITFAADADQPGIVSDGTTQEASWWLYNPADNTVNANPSVWYVVRSADGGSYAKVHATDIQQNERQISFELFIQGDGADTFDTVPVVWTAAIGPEGGALCHDFDSLAEVDCSSAADSWDLQVQVSPSGREWQLWTNGGLRGDGSEGASFGPFDDDRQADVSDSSSVPVWNVDATGGIFETQAWYAYDLQGNNQIWPNYRVYAIDIGNDSLFKLQILGYYDENGTSGIYTLRYAEAP